MFVPPSWWYREVYWRLLRETGQELEQQVDPDWLWCGRRVRVADDSTLLIPDTPANRQKYPLQTGLQADCHLPVVRILVVFSLIAGCLIDAALRPYQGKGTGETAMLRELSEAFEPGDVLLGDRYFSGYWDIAWWLSHGVDVVTRLPVSRRSDFRRGQRLGKDDHLVVWRRTSRPEWLSPAEADALSQEVTLREVRVRIKVRGFRAKSVIFVTTLLDAEVFPATKLAELYRRRWQAELNLRSLKTQMQMEQLRTKKPTTIRKEFAMHLLAYNCVRRVMLEVAQTSKLQPWEISFKGTLQTLLEFLARFHQTPTVATWVEEIIKTIAQLQVGHRPNRVEPYAVKRRPKAYVPLTEPRAVYKNESAQILSYPVSAIHPGPLPAGEGEAARMVTALCVTHALVFQLEESW